jgi:hypothetical protein
MTGENNTVFWTALAVATAIVLFGITLFIISVVSG